MPTKLQGIKVIFANNKYKEMTLKEKIKRYAQNAKKRVFSQSELTKEFRLHPSDKKEVSAALRRLLKEKVIIRQGRGKFSLYGEGVAEGMLRGNRRGFAFLCRAEGEDIFIPPRALGNAIHGDRVKVRLTGESEGEVIEILQESPGNLVGTFMNIGAFSFVRPDDDSFAKDIRIPRDKTLYAHSGQKVIANITSRAQGILWGEVEKILGEAGNTETELLSILYTYGFSSRFSVEVMAASAKLKGSYSNRTDFTNLLTITIDGEDAKDFDDAISIEKNAKGYKLYVHIADVSHYVAQGGVIDKAAAERTTSVYFPGMVFPMLPQSISNELCSLSPNEDKLTMTAILDFDLQGRQVGAKFAESVIRSDYRMTYTIVTGILQGDTELVAQYAPLVPFLQSAKELALLLAGIRKAEGMIDFATQESLIQVDENLQVTHLAPYPYEISNVIIEQFMIAANRAVAQYLSKANIPSIYRVHEKISPEKLQTFIAFIATFGFKLNLQGGALPKVFSEFLDSVKDSPQAPIINKILLRSMQKARYDIKNTGHFGLALQDYCHFTAPIRRYPDLMVHRSLKALIDGNADTRQANEYQEAAIASSERELAAERTERDAKDYFKALYMKDHIGKVFEGTISGIVSTGFFVMLDNTAEGFVALDSLPPGRYEADLSAFRIKGPKVSYVLCDKVKVRVKAAAPAERRIDFELVI